MRSSRIRLVPMCQLIRPADNCITRMVKAADSTTPRILTGSLQARCSPSRTREDVAHAGLSPPLPPWKACRPSRMDQRSDFLSKRASTVSLSPTAAEVAGCLTIGSGPETITVLSPMRTTPTKHRLRHAETRMARLLSLKLPTGAVPEVWTR